MFFILSMFFLAKISKTNEYSKNQKLDEKKETAPSFFYTVRNKPCKQYARILSVY